MAPTVKHTIGQPLLGVPDEPAIIDVMCFGPPLKPSDKRWKKRLDQIMSRNRFDPASFMSDAEVDEWVKTRRHKVMYRDESRIDSPGIIHERRRRDRAGGAGCGPRGAARSGPPSSRPPRAAGVRASG